VLFQRASKCCSIGLPCPTACHDDDVEASQRVLLQAKTLPDQAFDAVSIGGVAYDLFRYSQTKARIAFRGVASQYRQVPVRRLLRFFEYISELGSLAQATVTRELMGCRNQTF
jgi:hypothetical protein